jgi:hypothetical protein
MYAYNMQVALLKHIWSRSPAFFRALDDIKGLQNQVTYIYVYMYHCV